MSFFSIKEMEWKKKIPILFHEELSEISIDEFIPSLVCRTLILNLSF